MYVHETINSVLRKKRYFAYDDGHRITTNGEIQDAHFLSIAPYIQQMCGTEMNHICSTFVFFDFTYHLQTFPI